MATKKSTPEVPQDGQTYVRNTDGSLTPFNEYPNQGGSYLKNQDGTLSKITANESTPEHSQELTHDL